MYIHKCHALCWHISLTTLCWWCSSPSEVELALETTFARDKKRFQYADVNHDGGVDNEEFIYFLHPESGDWVVGGWGLVDFPVGVGLSSMYSRAGGPLWSRVLWGMSCGN